MSLNYTGLLYIMQHLQRCLSHCPFNALIVVTAVGGKSSLAVDSDERIGSCLARDSVDEVISSNLTEEAGNPGSCLAGCKVVEMPTKLASLADPSVSHQTAVEGKQSRKIALETDWLAKHKVTALWPRVKLDRDFPLMLGMVAAGKGMTVERRLVSVAFSNISACAIKTQRKLTLENPLYRCDPSADQTPPLEAMQCYPPHLDRS